MDALESLKADFNQRITFREKRKGIFQVLAPLYHEDGDMVDMFIDMPRSPDGPFRVSDHGLTLMRLSYNFDVETPHKRRILDRILAENGVLEERGRFYIETAPQSLYPALLQFAQTIAKVSSMQAFKAEVIHSLFYEMLGDFVKTTLAAYQPVKDFMPVPARDDLEVDWKFGVPSRNIFLYGVRGNSKARLAALTCRELQILKVPFRSVIVHEDFESGLTKKDQSRITNAADKQFASLTDFKAMGEEYFKREVEHTRIH